MDTSISHEEIINRINYDNRGCNDYEMLWKLFKSVSKDLMFATVRKIYTHPYLNANDFYDKDDIKM